MGKRIDNLSQDDYLSFFEIWLRYHNYRKYIGLSGIYQCLVLIDITNYFDSIQHSLLLEYMGPFGLPRQALGVLGQLLQALRPDAGHSAAPAVGIPVDSYDCSRILANVFLFDHDRRITTQVPEDSYTRFMDDHAIGVQSEVRGKQVIRFVQESMNTQRLQLNAAKTRMLNQAQIVEQFWLDENKAIDELEAIAVPNVPRAQIEASFNAVWGVYQSRPRTGQWVKVGKRLYRLAAKFATSTITLEQCQRDLVEGPLLAENIFRYLLLRDRYTEYVQLFEWFLESGNSVYEDVEEKWFESLLFVSPPARIDPDLVRLSFEFVGGAKRGVKRGGPQVPAALLMYWLGPLNAGVLLESILSGEPNGNANRHRAIAAILAALVPAQVDRWLTLAAREPSPQVSHLTDWFGRLRSGDKFPVPTPLSERRRPLGIGPSVVDTRSWLRMELLVHSPRPELQLAVRTALERAKRRGLSRLELTIAERIEVRLR